MELEKPKDWPVNDRERFLDEVIRSLGAYITHPSYEAKDALVNLACNYDYHQKPMLGMCRVTDYEVMLVNSIYQQAHHYFLGFLTSRLYEIIADVALMEKLIQMGWSMLPGQEPRRFEPIKAYMRLVKPLQLFYFGYQEYVCCKDDPLSKYLIRNVRYWYECDSLKKHMPAIAMCFSMMLLDLSVMRGTPNEREIHFNRKELAALFAEEAKLIALAGLSPTDHPFLGILNIQISNFILLSRGGYYDGVSYKCIHTEDAKKSWVNGQLWMRKTELLNDDREGACLRELLNELPKMGYGWLRKFDLKPTRRYWVSSFTKRLPTEKFKGDYGRAVYGFKGDRSAELMAPLMKRHWVRSDGNDSYDDYALSQVVCMDVLYDKAKAKSELKFLCSVVDRFKMSAKEKRSFLEEIMQYWMLSVKDRKWKGENERRYVLFDHFGDEYLDTEFDEKFLKLKTDLLRTPDFIVSPHPLKAKLFKHIGNKIAKELSPCMYCEDCLNRDYYIATSKQEDCKCSICGSHRLRYVNGCRKGCNSRHS